MSRLDKCAALPGDTSCPWIFELINPFYYGIWKYFLPHRVGLKVLYFGRPEGILSFLDDVEVCAVSPDAASAELLQNFIKTHIGPHKAHIRCISYEELKSVAPGNYNGAVVQGWHEWLAIMQSSNPSFSSIDFFERVSKALEPADFILIMGTSFSVLKTLLFKRRFKLQLSDFLVFKGALYGPELYMLERLPLRNLRNYKYLRTLAHLLRGGGIGLLFSKKSMNPDSFIDQMIEEQTKNRSQAQSKLYFGSSGVHLALTKDWIYRISQSEIAEKRCAVNYAMLEHMKIANLPFQTPAPGGVYKRGGHMIFVESRLPGKTVDYLRLSRAKLDNYSAKALGTLRVFQRQTLRLCPPGHAEAKSLFSIPLSLVGPNFDSDIKERMRVFGRSMAAYLDQNGVQLCFSHGDFKIGNILWGKGCAISGIIDWDQSSKENFPLLDALTYLAFDKSVAEKIDFCQALCQLNLMDLNDTDYAQNFPELKLDPVIFNASVVLALLRYGTAHLDFLGGSKSEWYGRQLALPLKTAIGKFLDDMRRQADPALEMDLNAAERTA